MSHTTLWISAAIAAFTTFFLAWLVAKKMRFFSLVDPVWALSIGVLSVTFLILGGLHSPAAWLAIAISSAWSLRLTHHLSTRLLRHFPKEDRRYEALRKTWSDGKFLGFFLLQALSVLFLALPSFFISCTASGEISFWLIIGALLSAAGWAIESLADTQLRRFRLAQPGKVCDSGLWSWSRHPNYFGEWLVWLGLACLALPTPSGWLAFLAPLTIGYLIVFVTGIPPAEASSLASKGDAYRAYQAKTSRFFPLPPTL